MRAMSTAASAYGQQQVLGVIQSNSKSYLIGLLNQKIVEHLRQAIRSVQTKNMPQKNESIAKALRIIDEGLINCVDTKQGEVAQTLLDFYLSTVVVITHANLKNNTQDLEKIADTYTDMQNAWFEIAKQVKWG